MKIAKRAAALIGAITLASTLAACGGDAQEVDADEPDQSQPAEAGDGKISIAETNAAVEDDSDNLVGICKQAFGEIEDVIEKLDIDVPENAKFGYSGDRFKEGGGWADEYFSDDDGISNEGSDNGTIRCQAHAFYDTKSVSGENLSVNISVTGGDKEPRGNTDFTVSAEGMTAGIRSSTSSGSGMQETTEDEIVEQSVGEQFLTDNVLPKFKP